MTSALQEVVTVDKVIARRARARRRAESVFLGMVTWLFLYQASYTIWSSRVTFLPEKLLTVWLDVFVAGLLMYLLASKVLEIRGPAGFLLTLYLLNALTYQVGSTIGGNFFQSYLGLRRVAFPALFFIFAFSVCTERKAIRKLTQLIAACSFVIGLIGIITYFLVPRHTWLRFLINTQEWTHLVTTTYGGVFRMTSVVWNPLYFGQLMAINCALALAKLLFVRHSGWTARFWNAHVLVCTIGLVFCFSRGAWIVFVISVAGISFVRFHAAGRLRSMGKLAISGTVIIVLIFGLGSIVNLESTKQVNKPFVEVIDGLVSTIGFSEYADFYNRARLSRLLELTEAIQVAPLGFGLGAVGPAASMWRIRGLAGVTHGVAADYIYGDSGYNVIALETGVHSLILFFCFLLSYLLRVARYISAILDRDQRAFVVGSLVVVAGATIVAWVQTLWHFPLVSYIIYALMGASYRIVLDSDRRVNREIEPLPLVASSQCGV